MSDMSTKPKTEQTENPTPFHSKEALAAVEQGKILLYLEQAQNVILDVVLATRRIDSADEDLMEALESLRKICGKSALILHRAEIALDRHRQGLATSLGVRKVLEMLNSNG